LRCTKKKKKKATTALLPLPSFATLRCSAAKQVLQHNVAFFAMLRCKAQRILWSCRSSKAAPQTNKQNKREKKSKMLT
jgi:hypothetical protein